MESGEGACLCCDWLPDLESAGQLHLAEVPADGLLDERDLVVAMGTAQTQRPGTVQPCNQQHGPSTLPLEDKLLSDGHSVSMRSCGIHHLSQDISHLFQLVLLFSCLQTREVKVSNYHKLRASSANARSQSQRTF